MDVLKISVLGSLQVAAGQAIQQKFESNKVRGLFTYLVLEMQSPHNRETLAEMFWPEASTQAALANLRYALADLRKVIGDDKAKPSYLFISRERLQFNPASDYELDITEFKSLIETNDIVKLKQAVALYRGDFLAGFPSIESDPFEEWVSQKREQFKRQAIESLRLIVDHHEGRGEYQQAIPFARRQIELEPWLEEAHQQLMRLLTFDGQRSAALAQYEACRQILASELDVEPTQETIDLYQAIRDGSLERVSPLLKREPPAPGSPPFKGLKYFDESDTDLFFGRESLVSRLVDQIQAGEKTKGMKFLAIIGASGSGKSSLVRAGLIPALKRSSMIRSATVITPTEDPREPLLKLTKSERKSKERHLLFVDQFEELFTPRINEGDRRAFIDTLLDLMEEGSTRVIIALRADFYAACAPYEALRTLLSQNQEYIGPMAAGELRRAIEEPAREGGWALEPGLVDLFLHDIGADGDHPPEPGALPLLSHALLETWHQRSGRSLTLAGYAESGGVHGAITKTAETVFAQFTPEEQAIARNIFLRLTELGEGTQETRRRASLSELIPPPASVPTLSKSTVIVLKMLTDARLVTTAEATAEVAHEALIREWNRLQEWLAENREGLRLHRHLTESAQEWHRLGKPSDLLYRGTRLTQALEWAETHASDLNPMEEEFLLASRDLTEQELVEREAQRQRELEAAQKLADSERQRAEGQTRSARQLRQRAYILSGILLLALILAVIAFLQRNATARQAHLAAGRELALASINNLNIDAELSILLALQAISESESANLPIPYEVQDALHRAIQNSRIHYTISDHTGEVAAVAFSPDGKTLATAGIDSTTKIRESVSGNVLITLGGHKQTIEDIAFSPDGKILATASDDQTAKIWDVASGRELLTLSGQGELISNVSFSADGTLLATAGTDTVKVWNVHTGEVVKTLEGQSAPAAFSPIRNQLATSSSAGTTIIWDSETWEEFISLPYLANALTFSPDGERLATAMFDLKVWEVSTGDELYSATGFTAPVMGIGFNPDGSQLATGGQDGTAIIWEAETGRRLFALAGHAGAINDVSYHPGCVTPPEAAFAWCGVWLATAGRDGRVKIWDVSPGGSREVTTLPGFSGMFLDETHLFTTSLESPTDINIQTWALSPDGNSQWNSSRTFASSAPLTAGSTSPNGMYLVTSDSDNLVKVWNIETGEEKSEFTVDDSSMIFLIAISPDGNRVVTGRENQNAIVWDATTGKKLHTLGGPAGLISGLTISLDGTRIATGHDDGTVIVWDVLTGNPSLTLAGHSMSVYAIAFSQDGKRIATAGMDQTVRIWDTASGKNILILKGHSASILAIAFSPNGTRLVTGSHDATAKIWDVSEGKNAGQEIMTLSGHDGYVDTILFSPDGNLLATGSFQDGTMRVYMLDIPDVARLARSRLTRTLTMEECQIYLHQKNCP